MNTLNIKDLEIYKENNRLKDKKNIQGKIIVSIEVNYNEEDLFKLEKTEIDYEEIIDIISEYFKTSSDERINELCNGLSRFLLTRLPFVLEVTVEIKDKSVNIVRPLSYISMKTTKGYNKTFIYLGSEVYSDTRPLEEAIDMINSHHFNEVKKISKIYNIAKVVNERYVNYYNVVIEVKTLAGIHCLKEILKDLEYNVNKLQENKFKVEILFFNDDVTFDNGIEIPTANIKEDYIFKPMMDIAPNFIHPIYNKPICEIK